jgi:chaperone modulatory protein CbpM
METDQLISADQFCISYNVSLTFVRSLLEFGLVESVTIEETQYIQLTDLEDVERMVRLHDELDINMEGIEAIHFLLGRIREMRQEMIFLQNRLRFYEG